MLRPPSSAPFPDTTRFRADATLSAEGTGQSASGAATDKAGNSASTTVSGIKVGKTAATGSSVATGGPNTTKKKNSGAAARRLHPADTPSGHRGGRAGTPRPT